MSSRVLANMHSSPLFFLFIQALLGSLVWGGTYTAGVVPGSTTTASGAKALLPVLGATGVYKNAKYVPKIDLKKRGGHFILFNL